MAAFDVWARRQLPVWRQEAAAAARIFGIARGYEAGDDPERVKRPDTGNRMGGRER
jgi:hypothetical protein